MRRFFALAPREADALITVLALLALGEAALVVDVLVRREGVRTLSEPAVDSALSTGEHAPKPQRADSIIDVNTATVEELDELPGIGPALAGRIVEYRKRRRFTSVEELTRVSGIGEVKLERLRPYVTVGRAGSQP